MDPMDRTAPTIWDRLGVAGIALLIVAFVFAALTPLVSAAGATDQLAANRDDPGEELVAVSDDDDDDDDDSDDSDAASKNSGQPSIGSNSGNTATGTTRGTGPSNSVSNSSDKSKNTATGTTRGTGASKSVSNSS